MKTLIVLTIFVLADCKNQGSRYGFFRSMERESSDGDTRRVFGGEAADLSAYPAAAALLDRYWTTRCSGAVIASHWALTAAHCVTSRVAYIKYNTRHPTSTDGDHSPVLYLYRHPNYKVVQEDEGRGMDVTLLHHDLGLLRSRDPMILRTPIEPISSLRKFNPSQLDKQEVMVMGFGRTETVLRSSGEELFAVKLQLTFCERGAWFHCVCGMSSASKTERGVCSGDSGGPVVYRGIQIGVTSMGPLECATSRSTPAEGATSVFTTLFNYVDLINATMTDTENTLKKRAMMSGTVTSMVRLQLSMIFMVILVLLV
ncbi:chymotrypsin-1-like [Pectinophora gossypiella]|uniref:chymotrypsin-1-like n=1 Tax=Pectinophora gossypiella TaxID=13191 RepID=UPI00214F3659|nr:chymotrypsin-1-like [Pectinophora gossypiella]XP_049865375.1 chymotrypsin-1-like [Pectinophora gossypiella]XP_049865376.1 chymotrypsin-1-like [Pectinophora gossypiella]XP_049865377.1 chymotrypsin-1-like [Pectinophora gossypiella]XP_049865378.1 chymotrypsin-1-like [Pectinophora gossypiella]XP_049865379.1 chymotrypsin-1-like [Pectinophora gossypiella]XP_049865381.1 chymotrypsin-1-like [Pectinophora gossypiella]